MTELGAIVGASDIIIQSLHKFADFHDRASRAEFWTFLAFFLGAQACARLVDAYLGHGALAGPVTILTSLTLLVPLISVAVRRLHDIDRSGREFLGPCLALLASPVMMLLASFLGSIVGLGYAAVILLLFGRLPLLLARAGARYANHYGDRPMDFSLAR